MLQEVGKFIDAYVWLWAIGFTILWVWTEAQFYKFRKRTYDTAGGVQSLVTEQTALFALAGDIYEIFDTCTDIHITVHYCPTNDSKNLFIIDGGNPHTKLGPTSQCVTGVPRNHLQLLLLIINSITGKSFMLDKRTELVIKKDYFTGETITNSVSYSDIPEW